MHLSQCSHGYRPTQTTNLCKARDDRLNPLKCTSSIRMHVHTLIFTQNSSCSHRMHLQGCASISRCIMQVDNTLHVLARACKCSLTKLMHDQAGAMLKLLKPAPSSVHLAVDIVVYSHLLMPWGALSHATQAAAEGKQLQLHELPRADAVIKHLLHMFSLTASPHPDPLISKP